ncbi:MAG: glycosyltransferase [Rhodospirillales bacterium]|nr:glycosyltransferase [Rhodospirillales bacterium]
MNKIRITHVITGLSTGGAENVLRQLVMRMDGDAFSNSVISLTDLGPVARRIEEVHVPVSAAGFPKSRFRVAPVAKLIAAVRRSDPHIVQTWMYHADLIGGIAAHFFAGVPVIWNLRQSTFDPQSSKKTTVRSARLCARLSNSLPHAIVCGSNAAHESHVRFGYRPDRMVVVPNGFDTAAFLPDPRYRSDVLRELGVGDEAFLVGLVARFDPQKDHATFFAAAARLAHHLPHAHFVLCGEGIDDRNNGLRTLVDAHGLDRQTHFLGLRDGLASFYPALDVLALSSSYGEGAPNVLGEAMSCGVPCVATDIGDAASMIGTTGWIVPCRNADALAAALRNVADMSAAQRRQLGEMARSRIVEEHPINLMVERYEDLYRRVYSQRYS